jgi:hypothetical protein
VRQSDRPDSSGEKLKGKYPELTITYRNGLKKIKPWSVLAVLGGAQSGRSFQNIKFAI